MELLTLRAGICSEISRVRKNGTDSHDDLIEDDLDPITVKKAPRGCIHVSINILMKYIPLLV